jgi:WD40 repeat protein
MQNGSIIVLDSNKMSPICKRVDRHGEPITIIKFSPNDLICAVGAYDKIITIHDV